MSNLFSTSFCNNPHDLLTGRPVGHECYILPPRALAAEREGNVDLANHLLAISSFKSRGTVRGRREPVVASLTDDPYSKPFKFLPRHGAYLVTLQDMTSTKPGMYDVVPESGDRALPKGIIEQTRLTTKRLATLPRFHAFLYQPGHAGRYDLSRRLGEFHTIDEAIEAILAA